MLRLHSFFIIKNEDLKSEQMKYLHHELKVAYSNMIPQICLFTYLEGGGSLNNGTI